MASDPDWEEHIEICLRWPSTGRTVPLASTETLKASDGPTAFLRTLAEVFMALAIEMETGADDLTGGSPPDV